MPIAASKPGDQQSRPSRAAEDEDSVVSLHCRGD
jgi:hypothetical protein